MRLFLRLFNTEKKDVSIDMHQFTPLPTPGYLVGGAVRDTLLGRKTSDIDWVVSDPERSAKEAGDTLGGSAFVLDAQRGHWRVVAGGETRDYAPLTTSIEENLGARDFTVNALALDLQGHLINPTGGQQDLTARTLRMVSRTNLFSDPLRPLRGVRFTATLGFELELETAEAIREHAAAQLVGREPLPAWERVGEELNQLMLSGRAAQGVNLLHELGLLKVYLGELAEAEGVKQGGFHHLDVLGHSTEALNQLLHGFPDADLSLRWGTLLHDVGKPPTKTYDEAGHYHFYAHDKVGSDISKEVIRRLRQPSERVDKVSGLVRYHMLPLPRNQKEARRFVHRRRELLPDLLKLMIADREAARGPMASEAQRQAYRVALGRVLEILAEPAPEKPLLDGRDVMQLLDLSPGPRVGEAVRFVREAEAVEDVRTKDEAEEVLRRYAREQGW